MMPIPFIAAAVIATSAVTGIGSSIKAAKNTKRANELNEDARSVVRAAEDKLDNQRKKAHEQLEQFGLEKIHVLSTSVKEFVHHYSTIKHVEMNERTHGIEELAHIAISTDLLTDLETESFEAAKIASGGLTSIGTGVATAYGAYTGVAYFGAASTGAKIAGLSGIAAKNATLAWLGGGALKAGGLGVAGGTMVLGGLVTGPALAVGGLVMNAQSKKKLNAAYDNYNEAKVVAKQMGSATTVLKAIWKRSEQLTLLLQNCNSIFITSIHNMVNVINASGSDWKNYTRIEKETVQKAVLLAQLIKGIIDTPLLDEDGAITKKSKEVLELGEANLMKISSI